MEHVTAEDVVRYGFGDSAGPFTLGRIAQNVGSATGKSTTRIVDILTRLLDSEMIEPARKRCYALTEKAIVEYGSSVSDTTTMAGRRILESVPDDGCFDVASVAANLQVSPQEIEAEIKALEDAGAIHDIGGGLLDGAHYLKDPSTDRNVFLEVRKCGPALRKAIGALRKPMSQRELADAMSVTRERARQVTQILVERGLATRKPGEGGANTVYLARAEAVAGLQASGFA